MTGNRLAVERILMRPGSGDRSPASAASGVDGDELRRIADWLDRHSVSITGDDGGSGLALELRLRGGDGLHLATVGELLGWWRAQRAGERMDWSRLRRA